AGARSVHQLSFDAEDFSQHRQIFAEAKERVGAIELTVVAFGILGDQDRADTDPAHAAQIAIIDYTAQVSVLTVAA
ncbi:TPA: hypothetical protein PY519_003019, partial [Staphylococcus aureus]|nr:hypothetical protein [Staphylococcus aureus]